MTRAVAMTVLAAALVVSTGCKKGDAKLVGHMEDLTEIMTDNEDSPADGIEELRSYMRSNLPDMASAVAEIVVEIDEIDDAGEKAERAEEVMENLKEAAEALEEAGEDFGKAAMKDEEAGKLIEEITESYKEVMEKFGKDLMRLGVVITPPSFNYARN